MNQRLFCFAGGDNGIWTVTSSRTVCGDPLPAVKSVSVLAAADEAPANATWLLHGVTSNERYVVRDEKNILTSKQQGLARPEAVCAALIPLRKNNAWWVLSQDERRAIFEDQSEHIKIGVKYLPAIARKLHHCRDLATAEPFDFITWFEYAPEHASAFDELLAELRSSPEWRYVDREIDIRMLRS